MPVAAWTTGMNTAGVPPTSVAAGPVAVNVNVNDPVQSTVPITAPATVARSGGAVSQAGRPLPEAGGTFVFVGTTIPVAVGVGVGAAGSPKPAIVPPGCGKMLASFTAVLHVEIPEKFASPQFTVRVPAELPAASITGMVSDGRQNNGRPRMLPVTVKPVAATVSSMQLLTGSGQGPD
jgi:hypothetical protein